MIKGQSVLIALVLVISISAACARDEEAYAPTPVGTGPVALVFDGEGSWVAYVNDGTVSYDKLCVLNLACENGLVGRVVQDVVTEPPRKWARIQGRDAYIEWHCGYKPGCDAVIEGNGHGQTAEHLIEKTRPDDFLAELRHIEAAIDGDPAQSPIMLHLHNGM